MVVDIEGSGSVASQSNDTETEMGAEWDALTLDDEDDGPGPLRSSGTSDEVTEGGNSEDAPLCLPSTLGTEVCVQRGLQQLADQELQLRQGQANDALHLIRLSLGYKSFLFRKSVRVADSHREKLRSWGEVGAVEKSVKHQARVYSTARQAMIKLGARREIMDRYRVLKREDLKVSTALIHPNAHGLAGASLSWIWGADVGGDPQSAEWMDECK